MTTKTYKSHDAAAAAAADDDDDDDDDNDDDNDDGPATSNGLWRLPNILYIIQGTIRIRTGDLPRISPGGTHLTRLEGLVDLHIGIS